MDFRLLALMLSAHLIADYIFQTGTLIKAKKAGELDALLFHIFSFGFFSLILTLPWWSWLWISLVALITFMHGFIDVIKIELTKKKPKHAFQLELIDLSLHLLIIIVIIGVFSPKMLDIHSTSFLYNNTLFYQLILLAATVSFTCRGGTVIVNKLTNQVVFHSTSEEEEKDSDDIDKELVHSSTVVTKIERLITFVFVLYGQYLPIIFLILTKTVAEHKNLDNKKFVDFFVISTFTSILIAILAAEFYKFMLTQVDFFLINLNP